MAKTDITLNILSNNHIETHLKFINTITRILTGCIFIVALIFYLRNQTKIKSTQ
jgi:hypothetical protein